MKIVFTYLHLSLKLYISYSITGKQMAIGVFSSYIDTETQRAEVFEHFRTIFAAVKCSLFE